MKSRQGGGRLLQPWFGLCCLGQEQAEIGNACAEPEHAIDRQVLEHG
jgi:hypothetical protein